MFTSKGTPEPSQRKHSTRNMFYKYWVLGLGLDSLDVGGGNAAHEMFQTRDIPTRSGHDAKRLRHGEVNIEELWDKYLTDFQRDVAAELQYERQQSLGM